MIGAALESAMNVFCDGCGTRLRTRYDTNGMGSAHELVEPCPTCIGRYKRALLTKTGPTVQPREGECETCRKTFRWAKPGPLPNECPPCRKAPKVRTFTCAGCRNRIEWTKPGQLPEFCDDCHPRNNPAPVRRGECRECGGEITKSTKGVLPKTCKRCKRMKRLECEACGEVRYVQRSRGPYPKRCEGCA